MSAKGILRKASGFMQRARDLLSREIWEIEHLGRKTVEARLYALLRVLTLTFQGSRRNRIPVQAAALTYYSLIGLGPLLAIMIMVSSFVIDRGDENLALKGISRVIAFAAPTAAIETDGQGNIVEDGDGIPLTPEMTELLNGIIEKAQSGAVGVIGSLMLLVIGIQVLSSIEGSFNHLWGVKQGRKLTERVVFYWTIITLGAVLGFASLTLITLNTIRAAADKVLFASEILEVLLVFTPVLVFLMVVSLFATFFRLIPNTKVKWAPAFTGATFATAALYVYSQLSFLYVGQVTRNESLYGSVGIIVVLMIGLFVFWLVVLIGAQLTYAVQNADYLTNENAWQSISVRARETVSLAALMMAGRKFARGGRPVRTSELLEALRVPSHILNSSINNLVTLGLLSPIDVSGGGDDRDRAYQPARPLDTLTLGQFKRALETHGNNEGIDLIRASDPAVRRYLDEIDHICGRAAGSEGVHLLTDFIDEGPGAGADEEPAR